jgi:hypothetical protein
MLLAAKLCLQSLPPHHRDTAQTRLWLRFDRCSPMSGPAAGAPHKAGRDPIRTSQLERYDERYVFSARDLKPITQRLESLTISPALAGASRPERDYEARPPGRDTQRLLRVTAGSRA